MGKKYHAVCVGRNPGLYYEWGGPNGAEAQKSGISGYNQKEGILSTNNQEEAIAFLKTHTIRKVMFHYIQGEEMSFDDLVRSNANLAALMKAKKTEVSNAAQELSKSTELSDTRRPDASPASAVTSPEKTFLPRSVKETLKNKTVKKETDDFCRQHQQFKSLSIAQRLAVQSVDGKFLLFAVPGSGKTTVLMARAGYMVHVRGISAGRMMTMTFTKLSAKEMRDRYCRYFPDEDESSIPEFCTIHSFCMRHVISKLRRGGFHCPVHVIDEDRNDKTKEKKEYTQKVILSDVLKNNGIRQYTDEDVQEIVQTTISGIKNRQLPREEYSGYSLIINKKEYAVASLYESYQKKLCELDCMDYDDMLIYSLHGLKERPGILRELQASYQYWSIDEAQDNSKVQNELLDLLCGANGNLFMVGDDDQSIYSFRGAEPSMLLDFGKRTDVQTLVMGMNYRSDRDIVNSAKAFIEYNHHRADKQMEANTCDRGTICIPESFHSEAEQYAYIDRTAKECLKSGKSLGVLYQMNASAFPLIVHMHRAGIPFEASCGLTELLNTKAIGSIFRVLRFIEAPRDLKAFRDCRKDLDLYYVTEDRIKRLEQNQEANPETDVMKLLFDSYEKDNPHREDIQRVSEVLEKASSQKPAAALAVILKELPGIFSRDTLGDRLYLYAVMSVCDLYGTTREMLDDLDAMQKREKQKAVISDDSTPDGDADSIVITGNKPAITLSTIHSAKGREWNHVVLIDSFEELLPGKPRQDRIGYDPEEARRVFYVAVTRAINKLDILTVDAYHGNVEKASPFITQFAYEADRQSSIPVEKQTYEQVSDPAKGVQCKLEPAKYYSVPFDPGRGVYTDWDEVAELKKGKSIPQDLQPKGHDTYGEAWERAFPGKPMPEPEKKFLADESIQKYIQVSGGPAFNREMDLPEEVSRGLLACLHTDSLQSLSSEQLDRLIEQSRFSWKEGVTNYRGREAGYAAAYMPVNFYKIWLPLWNLLNKEKLPLSARVFELGPGPGTSTWSIVEFYKRLAVENPQKQFSLNYTTVEKENGFAVIFQTIQEKVLAGLPDNLKVRIQMHTEEDAFSYMDTLPEQTVDLIVESNVLNTQEAFTPDRKSKFLSVLGKCLKNSGYAIFVEPYESKTYSEFEKFIEKAEGGQKFEAFCPADRAAVNVGGIRLFQDAVAANIRYNPSTQHWFSYAVLTPKKEVTE